MAGKAKNGAHYLLSALQTEKINHLFLVPGGMIDPIMRAFGESNWKISPIVAAHEGGAAFMADGYGRGTGCFGVVATIGGPGAANIVGALASAYADQTQILAIIGEVATTMTGKGAFQDGSTAGLDDLAYLRPISRWAQEIPTPELFSRRFNTGVREMLGIPAGPTVISIPMQILDEYISGSYRPVDRVSRNPPMFLDRKQASNVSYNLMRAERPVILAGSGCAKFYVDAKGKGSYSGAEALKAFAEKYEIPVATTLRGKGVFPEEHPLSLGVFGYAGTHHAHNAFLKAKPDFILAVGTSLNQRNTMKWHEELSKAKIAHVDISPTAFERNYPCQIKVRSDVSVFFEYLIELEDNEEKQFTTEMNKGLQGRREWLESICANNRYYNLENKPSQSIQSPIHPGYAARTIAQESPPDTVVLVDSGAHRAFMGHYWIASKPNSYLTATTLAPMGWAIPATIGAKLARPTRPHLCVTGDGCMLMHGIEIQTAAKYRLKVVFIVFNNGSLGNVFLRTQNMGAGSQAIAKLPTHDWAMFATSLGVEAKRVDKPEDLKSAINYAFAHEGGPFLIDLRCDPLVKTPTGPWASLGQALHD